MDGKAPLVPPEYYRETAKSLRQLAAEFKSEEVRAEVLALAADYDRLADFVEPVKRHDADEN